MSRRIMQIYPHKPNKANQSRAGQGRPGYQARLHTHSTRQYLPLHMPKTQTRKMQLEVVQQVRATKNQADPQPPQGGSQLSIIPVSEAPKLSSDFHGHQAHVVHTHTLHRHNIHIHKINKSKGKKKSKKKKMQLDLQEALKCKPPSSSKLPKLEKDNRLWGQGSFHGNKLAPTLSPTKQHLQLNSSLG